MTIAGAPTATAQTPDAATCVPDQSFLFDWGEVDWDPNPTFPYIETLTNIAGSGVDATVTIQNQGSEDIFTPQFPFPELIPYFGDSDTLRYWQNENAGINPVTVSFSEPVILDEIGSGGSRFLANTYGGTAFRAYSGADAGGSVVLPDAAVYPDPSVVAVVQQGDPLPGTAPINQIAPTTNLNVGYDTSDESFINVGLTGDIGWTVYDYSGVVVQSFVWDLFGSTVDNPLTARDNLTAPRLNSAYLSGFRFETCTPAAVVELYEVGNQLWQDRDNSGAIDTGEDRFGEGIIVTLRDSDGDLVATTETNADGQYNFSSLPAGTYTVCLPAANFEVGGELAGWHVSTGPASSTNPDDGVDNNNDGVAQTDGSVCAGTVTLEGDQPIDETDESPTGTPDNRSNLTVDFGLYQLWVGDLVWFDTDNDGLKDAGESPAPGVAMELRDTDGMVLATTVTDDQGLYRFSGLSEGSYVVAVVASNFATGGVLEGFTSSTGNNDASGLAPDPNDNVDDDDNGNPAVDGGIVAAAINLAAGEEPAEQGVGNPTVDFGVISSPTPGSTVPTTSQPPVVTLPETGAGGVTTMSGISVLLMLLGGGLLLFTARRPRRS